MWQDYLITIIMVAFSYALIPQIYQGFEQKKGFINIQTSLITFLGMYLLTIIYFTLGLIFSTVIGFLTGTMWLILFIQRIVYKN